MANDADAAPTQTTGSEPDGAHAFVSTPPSDNKDLGPLAALVLPRIFKLYDLTAGAEEYKVYREDAVFEDPLMKANGVRQIKSAFYSMQLLFSKAQIKEYNVKETSEGDSSGMLVLDNVQHYTLFGKSFDMVSRINLKVEDGLVLLHEDLWDRKPLSTPKAKGFTGSVAQGCRRANMLLCHLLMGFGRDLKPRTP